MDLITKKFGYTSKEMIGKECATLYFIISSYSIEIRNKYYDLIVAAGQKGILIKKMFPFL
jgi:hypothetical protein